VFQLRRVRSLDVSHNFFNSTILDGVSGARCAALEAFDAYNCFVVPLRG
jgi:hypothetical protein